MFPFVVFVDFMVTAVNYFSYLFLESGGRVVTDVREMVVVDEV